MQRTIHMHGVDFEVEFNEDGDVDALYIGGTEVTDVIRDTTKWAIAFMVNRCAAIWFDQYRAELHAAEQQDNRRAA